MTTRREFLLAAGALAIDLPARTRREEGTPLVSSEDLAYLRDLARVTIASATKSESLFQTGFSMVTPGGAYPALWVRDFSMGSGCGLISSTTLLKHLRLIASTQNGPNERRLDAGRAVIPPWAIPDHINFDGRPVFYPGTYSPGDDQGGEPFGVCPPMDGAFEFVQIAYAVFRARLEAEFLDQVVEGASLWERLKRAIDGIPADPTTGLCTTDRPRRAVGFGFCDTVYLTGSLLFPSLLRWRALRQMARLALMKHRPEDYERFYEVRLRIERSFGPVFEKDGWLLAATEVGRQPDVWGTIYALYLGAAQGSLRKRLLKTLTEAVRKGTITHKGAVRHVPTDRDFSKDSAWERTAGVPKNRYQNGAYWHVPSGWLARVLWEVDKPLARAVVKDMIAHFREEDFRKGGGAPWECLHPEGKYRQNPVYLASATLPLEALIA